MSLIKKIYPFRIFISTNGKVTTSLYTEPTSYYQYLHKSSHAENTKPSITYSQTLRVKRVCSKESDFKEHSSQLKNHGLIKQVTLKKLLTLKWKK